MSSPAIATRNRANAARSTGPATPQGKARSAKNALKLGLSIQRHVILDGEDPDEFEDLHAELIRAYAPESEREHLAVQEIAHCHWALRRIDAAETNTLSRPPLDPATLAPLDYIPMLHYMAAITIDGEPQPEWKPLHNLIRYRAHWERRHQRAVVDFDRAQSARYRAAGEQRAQARHQMAQARHQMAQECHQLAHQHLQPDSQRAQSATVSNNAVPASSPKLMKKRYKVQSGFVSYSEPDTRLQHHPAHREAPLTVQPDLPNSPES